MAKSFAHYKQSIIQNLDLQIDRIKSTFDQMQQRRDEILNKAADLQDRKSQIFKLLEGTRSQAIVLQVMEKELADYDKEINTLHESTDNMETLFVIEFDWFKEESITCFNKLIDSFM